MSTASISRPPRVNSFFVASADFYTHRPWKLCSSEATFVIHFPSSQATRYFSVLGHRERDKGLLMAYSDSDLILMHKRRKDRENGALLAEEVTPRALGPPTGHHWE
jgi:hypothetical protein